MNRNHIFFVFTGLFVVALLFALPLQALAQESQPESPRPQPLILYTQYPSRLIGFGETVNLPLKLRSDTAQTIQLEVEDLPAGWVATFRGGSQIVDAVYLDGETEASVELRLETPTNVETGAYELVVIARGERQRSELPVKLMIKEKLPARLSLTIDGLPTKRGTPTGTLNYNVTLKNEGGEDLLTTLSATQPDDIAVSVQSGGQDITEIELPANESKTLTVKADPLVSLEAGKYPFTVQATAGDISAQLDLTLEVIGRGALSLSAPDGRLSGEAYAGEENPLKITLVNTGTAPLRGIELTSSEPSGWSVSFDQSQIVELPAGQTIEVTAQIKPPEKAIAGDYVVTINARPLDNEQESAEFRITVRTSTLWGVAGVGLIALAVSVVGLAVFRFGRR